MNRAASAYICYGLIIVAIGAVYAYRIAGPSRLLFIVFGAALIISGIGSRNRDDDSAGNRDYLTLVSALSPGIVHLTTIYRETCAPKDLMTGAVLAMGFFGGFAFAGSAIVTSMAEIPLIGNPFPAFVSCVVLMFGCCDASITLVNGYCDSKGMPYTDGRFENHHEDPKGDAMKSAVVTIILAVVLPIIVHFLIKVNQESLSVLLIR